MKFATVSGASFSNNSRTISPRPVLSIVVSGLPPASRAKRRCSITRRARQIVGGRLQAAKFLLRLPFRLRSLHVAPIFLGPIGQALRKIARQAFEQRGKLVAADCRLREGVPKITIRAVLIQGGDGGAIGVRESVAFQLRAPGCPPGAADASRWRGRTPGAARSLRVRRR